MYFSLPQGASRRGLTGHDLSMLGHEQEDGTPHALMAQAVVGGRRSVVSDSGPGNRPVVVFPRALLPGPGRPSRTVALDAVWASALCQDGGPERGLLGGEGDDLVVGSEGRDVMIGGFVGTQPGDTTAADDTLTVGSTSSDSELAALDAVMAKWASA
jgi:hypothetical protein